MNILEKFLQDARRDNLINSVMFDKLTYRVRFYKEETDKLKSSRSKCSECGGEDLNKEDNWCNRCLDYCD